MATPTNPARVIEFSLGGVKLDRFEVPESFEIGHEVSTAVHKFYDDTGQPIKRVHAMGAFPIATSWKGELYSISALQRNYVLDNLCAAQQEIDWIFGSLKYRVLIKSYKGTVRYDSLVEYALELEIIKDLNGAATAIDGTAQFNQAMDQAYSQALNQMTTVLQYNLPNDISVAHTSLTSKINSLQPLQFASLSNLQSLSSQLTQFINQVNAYLGPLMSKPLSGNTLGLFNGLLNAVNSYTLLAINLQQITGGQTKSNIQQLFQSGESLFKVAARYYPKADIPSAAQAIARANGLTSMFLTSAMTLSIPPLFSNVT